MNNLLDKLDAKLPESFPTQLVVSGLIFIGALILVIILYRFVTRRLKKRAAKTKGLVDDFVIEVLRMPFLFLLIWILFRIFSQTVFFDTKYFENMNHVLEILLIVTIGWILIKGTHILFYFLENKARENTDNKYLARSNMTKLTIFERIINGIIIVLIVALCLMTFDKIKALGVSLLTSAGIAGIVVGFAAQKSLTMMLAGVQLAITQPIRLNDTVVVNGYNGVVEEINLTYVVIKLPDNKRIIVPVTTFIDQTVENWTLNSSNLLGTVYLYVDFAMPLDPLRDELKKILDKNARWDSAASSVQVTDMKPTYMEVRVLLSAEDSGMIWDLEVEVRERLVKFIVDNYPQYLVKTRIIDRPEDDPDIRKLG